MGLCCALFIGIIRSCFTAEHGTGERDVIENVITSFVTEQAQVICLSGNRRTNSGPARAWATREAGAEPASLKLRGRRNPDRPSAGILSGQRSVAGGIKLRGGFVCLDEDRAQRGNHTCNGFVVHHNPSTPQISIIVCPFVLSVCRTAWDDYRFFCF